MNWTRRFRGLSVVTQAEPLAGYSFGHAPKVVLYCVKRDAPAVGNLAIGRWC